MLDFVAAVDTILGLGYVLDTLLVRLFGNYSTSSRIAFCCELGLVRINMLSTPSVR